MSLTFKLTAGNIAACPPSTITLAELPGPPVPDRRGLEVVGETWALLVVRELALGAHRFTDMVARHGGPA